MHEVLTNQEVAAFWAGVKALLDDRAHDMAPGPRNVTQLAQCMGVARTTLHWQSTAAKSLPIMGEGVTVEAVAKAMTASGDYPMTVDALLLNAEPG